MRVKISDISKRNLEDIPPPCRSCIYWEFPQLFSKVNHTEAFIYKKNWFLKALNSFGVCGKILYVDFIPVAYAQFGPYCMFPQTKSYGDYKAGDEVIFLSCLFICKAEYRRIGMGSRLLNNVVSDLRVRGFSRIETFARKGSANNPSGPLDFYLKNGFKRVKELDQDFTLVAFKL